MLMINMNYTIENNRIVVESGINGFSKTINFEFLNNKIIRIFESKAKTDLIELNESFDLCTYPIEFKDGVLLITYHNYKIEVNSNLEIVIKNNGDFVTKLNFSQKLWNSESYNSTSISLHDHSNVYGLGDKMGPLNKKGYFYQTRNTDDPSHQDELFPSLYKSIPYMLIENNLNYFGVFFPSTFKYSFDVAKTNLNEISANNFKAPNDLFLFLGDSPKEITSNYSTFVGHPYFIRMKMLGYSQSRWSYENEKQVYDLAENFIKYKLPLDYIHLDIHYLDGYRDFTVDKNRFSNMKKLTKKLSNDDIEIVAINDAAIKKDSGYDIYKYLVQNKLIGLLNDKPYVNVVWPGKSVFPNYLDADCKHYMGKKASIFLKKYGISGIWNDMNEPASFNGELPLNVEFNNCERKLTNEEVHNVYGEHMVKSFVPVFKNMNKRPYLFTRAAFATTAKYAFVRNGDNFSLWHHLQYSITQNLSLSMSNFMFNGVDIGGFGGDTTKELLVRWLEADLFMPFLRNHSSLNTKFQEPYMFDEETLDIFKKYLNIRYSFIPYLYNCAHEMSFNGIPMIRPLFYNFPKDQVTLGLGDQYMVGDNLMVAPIITNGKNYRSVYFPEGKWVDYLTDKEYDGNSFEVIKMNLGSSGYFVKYNSIIPNFENLLHINKEKIDTLILKIYGNEGDLSLYDDDGDSLDYEKGIYNIYEISYKNHTLHFSTKYHKYNTKFVNIKIIFNKQIIIKKFEYNQDIDLEEYYENN